MSIFKITRKRLGCKHKVIDFLVGLLGTLVTVHGERLSRQTPPPTILITHVLSEGAAYTEERTIGQMRTDRNRQLPTDKTGKNMLAGRGQREKGGRVGREGGATLPCLLPPRARPTSQPQDFRNSQALLPSAFHPPSMGLSTSCASLLHSTHCLSGPVSLCSPPGPSSAHPLQRLPHTLPRCACSPASPAPTLLMLTSFALAFQRLQTSPGSLLEVCDVSYEASRKMVT